MKTIHIDFSQPKARCSNEVFGVCKFPNLEHCADILPKLRESGVTLLRVDLYPEQMLPKDKCPSLDYYLKNENNIQNTENWDISHLEPLKLAKNLDFKIMLSLCYSPDWLNHSVTHKGIPKDFGVYESILETAFSLVADYVDYCEIINETVYFMELDGSGYNDKYKAAADIFWHAARAVRRVNPEIPLGGLATEGPYSEEMEYLLKDPRFSKDSGLINFLSYHVYSSEDCTAGLNEIRNKIAECGYDRDIPVYIDEWNVTPQWESNEEKLFNYKSLPYVGKNLAGFMNTGARACFFANYPRLYPSDGFHERGEKTTLATYSWDATSSSGELLPMMKAYYIASGFLCLGNGDFEPFAETHSYGITAVAGAISHDRHKTVYIVNERPIPVTAEITVSAAENTRAIKGYQAHRHGEGAVEVAFDLIGGNIVCPIELPAYSVTGLILED